MLALRAGWLVACLRLGVDAACRRFPCDTLVKLAGVASRRSRKYGLAEQRSFRRRVNSRCLGPTSTRTTSVPWLLVWGQLLDYGEMGIFQLTIQLFVSAQQASSWCFVA